MSEREGIRTLRPLAHGLFAALACWETHVTEATWETATMDERRAAMRMVHRLEVLVLLLGRLEDDSLESSQRPAPRCPECGALTDGETCGDCLGSFAIEDEEARRAL